MKHYLIYQVRNKLNGMIYVGKHQTEDVDDGYMGSGLRIRRAIEKYGIENFEKTILFECSSAEEMNAKEIEIVNEDFIAREDVYNIKLGGEGGWDYVNTDSSYKIGSQKRHSAMIQASKNRDQKKTHIKASKTRQNWSIEKKKQVSKNISNGIKYKIETDKNFTKNRVKNLKGRKASNKLRHKLSLLKQGKNNNQYGKVWIMNVKLKQCKCVSSSYVLPKGWEYGRCLDFDKKQEYQKRKNEKKQNKLQRKENKLKYYRMMYAFFIAHDNNFELTAKQFSYFHTRNAFMTACKRFLPEYVPLPNNRWKNKN